MKKINHIFSLSKKVALHKRLYGKSLSNKRLSCLLIHTLNLKLRSLQLPETCIAICFLYAKMFKFSCNGWILYIISSASNVIAAEGNSESAKPRHGGQRTGRRYMKNTMFEAWKSLPAKLHIGQRQLVRLFLKHRKSRGE